MDPIETANIATTTLPITSSTPSPIIGVIEFVFIVLMIAALWKIFTKAGKPGWASIIPIYNTIVEIEIAGKPVWWVFLMFVPLVNIVIAFIIVMDLAKAFGKSGAWGFFLLGLLPFIGFPILGFGSARYLAGAGSLAGNAASSGEQVDISQSLPPSLSKPLTPEKSDEPVEPAEAEPKEPQIAAKEEIPTDQKK